MADEPKKIDCENQFFDSLRGKEVAVELLKGHTIGGVIDDYNEHVLIISSPPSQLNCKVLIYKSGIITVKKATNF